MNELKNKKALITGASSGIGRSIALDLGRRGAELFLVARREERLIELKNELLKENPHLKIQIIAQDINDPKIIETIKTLSHERIDIFINNAGIALGRDKLQDAHFSDIEQMINTNITAAFRLVHGILPLMLKNGEGDIINLCSVAGHYTYQGGTGYCATKHAILALTRILREETCGKNIRVMQISPGMVETEFSEVRFKGNKELAKSVYQGMTPLKSEDISRMMIFMLEQPRYVVIDDLITMPTDQGSPTTVFRK
jgi:3-hydroxy acid dehydrogenase/malonic semialdehyde reductase